MLAHTFKYTLNTKIKHVYRQKATAGSINTKYTLNKVLIYRTYIKLS